MMGNSPMGVFGQRRGDPRGMLGQDNLPGIISGYGGGTFDIGGRQVTPIQQPSVQAGQNGQTVLPQGILDILPSANARPLRTNAGAFDPRSMQQANQAPPQQPMPTGGPNGLAALIGQAPKRNKGSFGDVLATILSVAADATDPEGRGLYGRNLAQQWGKRRETYNNALTSFQNRQQMAHLPGMTQRELAAYIADPKAWASQMAGAATSRYQAATLNPGDQRFLGDGNGVYQAPTRGQLYAESLDLEPGSEAYATALRDQELGAQGPTAFSHANALEAARQQARAILEQQRQQGRTSLEGIRQGNRVNLRGVPTAGRTGPPRIGARPPGPTVPTASDGKGNTIYLRGGRWVDGQGRPLQ